MVEAVALGDCARERVGCDRTLFQQDRFGRCAAGTGEIDRRVDLLAADELEVDDHIGEEARYGTALRACDAVPVGVSRRILALIERIDGAQMWC